MKKIFLTIILMLVSFFFCTISVSAQTEIAGDLVKEETLEAKVETRDLILTWPTQYP